MSIFTIISSVLGCVILLGGLVWALSAKLRNRPTFRETKELIKESGKVVEVEITNIKDAIQEIKIDNKEIKKGVNDIMLSLSGIK